MILYFKVTNSRSFAKEAVLSMIASENYPEKYSYKIENFDIKILKTSLFYGANASGKSNLLKALADAYNIIINSHTYSKNANITEDNSLSLKYSPNKNDILNTTKPTSYTFGFYINNRVFEYFFSNDAERIYSESLIEKIEEGIEIVHFVRTYNKKLNEYVYPKFSDEFKEKIEYLLPFTKKENLFLSVSAQLSEDVKYRIVTADIILNFLKRKLHFSINLFSPGKSDIKPALELIRENKKLKRLFLELLEKADFSIVDIKFKPVKDENNKTKYIVKTYHKSLNENKEQVLIEYDLFEEESVGTLQYISWLGFWILASVDKKTLIIDEFGNSMHPLLSEYLVNLFQKNEGQLIFSTHDVKLMNCKNIKHEQIWIVKKDELSNSYINSLSEFNIDTDKMTDNVYLDGILNGVPNLKE